MKLSLGLTPRDYSVAGGVTYDADALAYFTANTAITSSADKNAINTFYLGLKSDNIYTKIKAMYLPIWGSAASSKWNLVNPLDTNAAFRLTFTTGWTYSSSGITPTNAYADTFLAPSTVYTATNDKHLSFYSRTNAAAASSSSIGSDSGGGSPNYCRLTIRGSSNLRAMIYGGTNGTYSDTETNSLGFYLANRSTSTASQLYKNGLLVGNGNSANGSTSQITQTLLIGAARSGATVTYYDNKQCAFASIGDSLTASETLNFYNRVNTLMTYFGINV